MNATRLPRFADLLSFRRAALGLCSVGLPLWALGCVHPAPMLTPAAPPAATARAAAADETLPAPRPAEAPPKVVPISLEAIFRLAEEQNAQVRLARERVSGACADLDVAETAWLPRVFVGPAYWRHEGGIQDEDGTLIHSSTGALFGGLELHGQLDLREATFQSIRAERELWQRKAELSRMTYETLLDATTTYIDLLAARTGEAVGRRIEARLVELLKQAEGLGANIPQGPVEAIRAQLLGQRQAVLKAHQLGDAASARLVYLLGLDPCSRLEPVDSALAPFALVDAMPCCEALVGQALAAGPGVRAMEGMLALLQRAVTEAQGPASLLPVLEVRMVEGAFGAGPGARTDWDNRWDLGLQARWDLTGLVTGKAQQRAADSRLQQAHLSYQDLRGKLAAGVQEAREAVVSGQEQLPLGREQIAHADRAYSLGGELLRSLPQKDRAVVEVLQSALSLGQAQVNYLNTVSAYDKAQLRLLLLLGPASNPPPPGRVCP